MWGRRLALAGLRPGPVLADLPLLAQRPGRHARRRPQVRRPARGARRPRLAPRTGQRTPGCATGAGHVSCRSTRCGSTWPRDGSIDGDRGRRAALGDASRSSKTPTITLKIQAAASSSAGSDRPAHRGRRRRPACRWDPRVAAARRASATSSSSPTRTWFGDGVQVRPRARGRRGPPSTAWPRPRRPARSTRTPRTRQATSGAAARTCVAEAEWSDDIAERRAQGRAQPGGRGRRSSTRTASTSHAATTTRTRRRRRARSPTAHASTTWTERP